MIKKLYFLFILLIGYPCLAQSDFVTRWDLSIPGSGPSQLLFHSSGSGPLNYTWKEISPGNASGSGILEHSLAITDLPAGSVIELRIASSNLSTFSLQNQFDRPRLIDVAQWGSANWASTYGMFAGCNNLDVSAGDIPDLSRVTSIASMFTECFSLTGPANINSWDVSNVIYAFAAFQGAQKFNQSLASWDVSNMANMRHMFNDAFAFNQDISGWDVSNVTTMYEMFRNAFNFNQDISSWDVSSVQYMNGMFHGAIRFNQDVSRWDISSVLGLDAMFSSAYAFDQDLSPWAEKLNPNVELGGLLASSGVRYSNYDAFLKALSLHAPVGRTMRAEGLKYCSASDARAGLTAPVQSGGKGWVITGDVFDCPLPVKMISFSGKSTGKPGNVLQWITADEIDFDHFAIERSADARSFETIGSVKNKAENKSTGVLSSYRFEDLNPAGMLYYRIKMVDTDGSFEYSKIISIQNPEKIGAVGSFYPNPAATESTIEIYASEKSEWEITTTDNAGNRLHSQKSTLKPGINKLQMKMLQPGLNLFHFRNGQKIQVRKVISAGR